MPFMMQDYYAGAKGAIELSQLEQQQQEQKDIANIYKQTTAPQAPTGFGPGATAPSGGLASTDSLMGTQEDPLKASVNAIRSSTQELQGLDKQMQFNTQAAEVYRKNGKVVEANKLLAENESLKQKQVEAQTKHLDNIKKSSEMMGGIAGAYIDQASDETTEPAARIELINRARDILPPQKVLELSAMPTDQLKAKLTQLRDGSMTAYQQAETKQKLINEQARIAQEDRLAKLNESQIKLNEARIAKLQNGSTSGGPGSALVAARAENLAGSIGELGRSLKIISNMDIKTTTGVFGTVAAGKTLFTAPLGATATAFTKPEQRQYNIAASNIGQALATIEYGGYKPTVGVIQSYQDKLAWKPTDTIETKVFALADAKEQAKARAEYSLASKSLPEEQKALIRNVIKDLDVLIPYSPEDITDMKKKGMSVSDWMKQKQEETKPKESENQTGDLMSRIQAEKKRRASGG